MSLWKIIKGLNYRQLTSLMVWFLKHPLYMISTISATLLTFRISQKHFPDIHGQHNRANAFRHALWNVVIARKCSRFSENQRSVLRWTKQITDWHEEFSPNEKLAEAMDLHNNQIGRNLFRELSEMKLEDVVTFMIKEMENAIKVSEISDIEGLHQLVYIED